MLVIGYAENEQQQKILLNYLAYQNENAKKKYQPFTDDEEVDISE